MTMKPDFELAPIVLFAYNRVDTLESTYRALVNNIWAADCVLYVFSDCYKSEKDKDAVLAVRAFIKKIQGFKSIIIEEATENQGLARSIINGVTSVIGKHDKVIVLEDDLIPSSNFLVYMNKALCFYEQTPKIFSISGYSPVIVNKDGADVYVTRRASSWGWGTWGNRWKDIDWEVRDYESFRSNSIKRKQFNEMGSDLCRMLDKQMGKKLNSWAIRWVYNQFVKDLYTVYPTVSKIENIGTSAAATNTRDVASRFKTVLDKSNQLDFNFPRSLKIDDYFIRQFLVQFSIKTRVKYKILNSYAYLRSLFIMSKY
jgi:hypothetical protein